MLTASQFAARAVGAEVYAPPKCAGDEPCWLCGGATYGVGWIRDEWLPPTFTNHNNSKCPSSQAICQQCVAMSSKEPWERYVAAHPEAGLKTGHAMSWRFYSHVFTATTHRCPTRPEWAGILLEPPVPPFLLVLTTSGQKHLIFRSRISHDRESYWLQVEEESLLINRTAFAQCLEAVERALRLGFMRMELEEFVFRSRRPPGIASLMEWDRITTELAALRQRHIGEFLVAVQVARKQEVIAIERQRAATAAALPIQPPPAQVGTQQELF